MKFFNKKFITGAGVSIGLLFSLNAYAGWELYDDFNSGSIDTSKWDVDESSAVITVTAGGLARFGTYAATFDDSAWLIMTQDVANIQGVKAKVQLQGGCNEDTRIRVGATTGDVPGGNYLWSQHYVRASPVDERIGSSISESVKADDSWLFDRFWGGAPGFGTTVVTDKWVVITMLFDKRHKQRFWSYYDGKTDGEIKKKLSPTPTAPEFPFVGIGTRTRDGDTGTGSCMAWVDWVRVYK